MESKVVKADFKKLDAFVKGLGGGYVVKVGIMGAKNTRNDKSGQTNADIGFIHEFGRPKTATSPRIPERSFLRMPILTHSARILKEMANIATLKYFADGDIVKVLDALGHICERVILDAFDTKGFSSWEKNAPSTIKRKGSSQPLIDLGFLRKSITSQVVKL